MTAVKGFACGAIVLEGVHGGRSHPCQVAADRIAGGGGVFDANNLHTACVSSRQGELSEAQVTPCS